MPVTAGLIKVAGGLAADRRLHRGVDVAGGEAVAGGLGAVDVDADGRLAERGRHGEVGDAGHGRNGVPDLVRHLGQGLEIGAVDLDGILALHARRCLLDVVLDVLREGELDAGESLLQGVVHLGGELFLVHSLGPLVERLQRHEELGIEEAGRIGAVVRSAVLGNHGLGLGKALDQLAHAVGVVVAGLERDRGRHDGANPHVAFFELGQELQADRAAGQDGDSARAEAGSQGGTAPHQHDVTHLRVQATQRTHRARLDVAHPLGQQQGGERRRHGEGGEQAARQGVGIGAGHRSEDVALNARQRE